MDYFFVRYSSSLLGKMDVTTNASGRNAEDAKERFKNQFKQRHGTFPVVHDVTPFDKDNPSE